MACGYSRPHGTAGRVSGQGDGKRWWNHSRLRFLEHRRRLPRAPRSCDRSLLLPEPRRRPNRYRTGTDMTDSLPTQATESMTIQEQLLRLPSRMMLEGMVQDSGARTLSPTKVSSWVTIPSPPSSPPGLGATQCSEIKPFATKPLT